MCVFCKKPATEVHHILDRKLFDDGGYYENNGASVCVWEMPLGLNGMRSIP